MTPLAPSAINYAEWKFYLDFVVLIFVAGNSIYTYWSNRQKVTSARFATLEKEVVKLKSVPDCCSNQGDTTLRLNGHNKRLGQHKEMLNAIEGELKHLPTNKDLGVIHEKINTVNSHLADLKAEVNKVVGAMPGVTHLTEMMNEFLLNQGRKP